MRRRSEDLESRSAAQLDPIASGNLLLRNPRVVPSAADDGAGFHATVPFCSSWLVRLSLLAASSSSYYNSQVPVRGAKDGDARTEIGGGSAGNATPKSRWGISRGNVSTERGAVVRKRGVMGKRLNS